MRTGFYIIYKRDEKSFKTVIAFDSAHPTGVIEKRTLVRAEQKPVSRMSHLHSNFSPLGWTLYSFCMGIESTAIANLPAWKYFKFFWSEADDICLSKAIPSVQKVFTRQMLNIGSDVGNLQKVQ